MTTTPIELQDLRRRIYRKAKSDKAHRFWAPAATQTPPPVAA